MASILFDDNCRFSLLPFTHTRPVADIRCGILTMRERWEHFLGTTTSTLTADYLQEVFSQNSEGENLYINAAVFAGEALNASIGMLNTGEALYRGDTLVALKTAITATSWQELDSIASSLAKIIYEDDISRLTNPWDIFSLNGDQIKRDFPLLVGDRYSAPIPSHVTVIGINPVFVEPGALLFPCTINARSGPVYIAKDTEVMEGCMIRGPFALCEHGVLKMGTKVYSNTTIGPGCKVGGEVSNLVMFANSNKGHDGFIGNAVIGEWCNLGADTNASNLKNNYDEVKVWSEHKQGLEKTGLQFCGLLMADHAKCGINTMFNTGTVVGVSANIFGGGFPDKFVPSFTWGGIAEFATYDFDKAMDTANRMMSRRGKELSEAERAMYAHVFEETAAQRNAGA